MAFRAAIEREAEREFADAVIFYEERKPGLGLRFVSEFQAFFNSVCENPDRFPPAGKLTRKARMPAPWPYAIYFVIKRESSEVVISAIWHGARNPDELRRRLK